MTWALACYTLVGRMGQGEKKNKSLNRPESAVLSLDASRVRQPVK